MVGMCKLSFAELYILDSPEASSNTDITDYAAIRYHMSSEAYEPNNKAHAMKHTRKFLRETLWLASTVIVVKMAWLSTQGTFTDV